MSNIKLTKLIYPILTINTVGRRTINQGKNNLPEYQKDQRTDVHS
jgi:hypothetical protein